MNREKELARIATLEAELAQLKKEIEEPNPTTYQDVVAKLKPSLWYSNIGMICNNSIISTYSYASEAITSRMMIRAKIENIALYVNGMEQEEVKKLPERWYLWISPGNDIRSQSSSFGYYPGLTVFVSEEAAIEALRILGEDEFRQM
jgi:hypothetical protein